VRLIILIVVGIFAIVIAAIWPSRGWAPSFSVVPIGRTVAPNGTAKFMVGVTNSSRSTLAFLVGLDVTTSSGQTALASEQQVVLRPKSGTQAGIDLKGQTLPWPLAVYYQRRPGPIEDRVRSFGVWLKLCGFPGWEKVAVDGFPSGHDTPEGVACDLARAWIKRDVSLFTNTCIQPFGSLEARTDYQAFLSRNVKGMMQQTTNKEASALGPKAIGRIFPARHFGKGDPSSYGYVADKIEDVMFVDVESVLRNGKRYLHRTLVIKRSDLKWYVHPAPETDSRLSAVLKDEAASARDFSNTYEVEK
jgi:hypothetical protein